MQPFTGPSARGRLVHAARVLLRGVVVGLVAAVSLHCVAQSTAVIKTDPIFKYQIYTGIIGQQFDSPQETLEAYQAYLNSNPSVFVANIFNPRPVADYPGFVNGKPILWQWDYFYRHPQSPSNDYGGTTGPLDATVSCPSAGPLPGADSPWKLQYEETASPSKEAWCEARVPFALNVADGAARAQPSGCNRCPCGDGSGGGAQDGSLVGNPIVPASGQKVQAEVDYQESGASGLTVSRTFTSTNPESPYAARSVIPGLWRLDQDSRISFIGAFIAFVALADGHQTVFVRDLRSDVFGPWRASTGVETLTPVGSQFVYQNTLTGGTQRFDDAGRPISSVARNGWTMSYAYSGNLLSRITNGFGRSLGFSYDALSRLAAIGLPDGRMIGYGYDSQSRLASVSLPDGTVKRYLYENAAFPDFLTGVVDEAGSRLSSFAYDERGRASTSQRGTSGLYQVSYPVVGSASVVDPLGTARVYGYSQALGRLAITSASLPSGTGRPDAAYRVQDDKGFVTEERDFNGVQTTTTWDATRRLPITVTRAASTPEAQTTTFQWHPTFSLPVLVSEAGRSTAFTYDNAGNVLSQRVTDAASGKAQLWQWTYTPQNLVATQTEPNGAVTSFTYDAAGNPIKAVDALGLPTLYAYDAANRIVSTTVPNGQITRYTYDSRDRVLSRTVGNLPATRFAYHPTGTLATLSLTDGLVLSFDYDAAHRLTGWRNNRGERGSFTLDAMGNRVGEQTLSSAGSIAWTTARSINQINRVASQTQGQGRVDAFGYDPNGERISHTNGLNQSTRYDLDALRRASTLTDAASATARLAWNAQDAITQASDFKGVATSYARDAQGNATAESSADIGTLRTQYDTLGLPIALVDAMGQATNIARDLLGRPISITFADGRVTTLRYDLTPSSKGYLSEITDRSGTTQYTRDAFGRVTLKRQTLISGLSQQVGYAYTANGLLSAISYPNGKVLGYRYDATGRLTQIEVNGQPVLAGLGWNPMGQPTGWNWAFVSSPLTASRQYDTAGQLVATEFSKYIYDAAGRITNVAQDLIRPADTDPTHQTMTGYVGLWNVAYDPVGRITGFNSNTDKNAFGYDLNGNRTTSTRTVNGQTTSRSFTVEGTSNRLLGFGQSIGSSSTNVAYGYNANGDLTSDGLKTFSYNAEGRLSAVTTGATDTSPTTRYAHNALGQRVFKTEPLFPPTSGDEANPSFMQSLIGFFSKLWAPSASDAEKLGFAFMYDEEGNLLSETGTGGANSTGSTMHIYLPTANGAMPVAVIVNGEMFAVHSDHLNTPRKITNASGQVVWQWAYSAFGEDEPSIAAMRFTNANTVPTNGSTGISPISYNLRYWGMYADKESGLFYNGWRSYRPGDGRYTQNDPIGLAGGPNRKTTLENNPLSFSDPLGLDIWGSYGYGRYLPATNPAPSFWERLNFPETPAQREAGENIALGFCGGGIGGATRGVSNAGAVIAETLAGKGNITSAVKLSADELLHAGAQFLGNGYRELGKSGSGVFRSADGARQFRIDNNSLLGNHAPGVPHGHLETYAPGAATPSTNNHIPFFD